MVVMLIIIQEYKIKVVEQGNINGIKVEIMDTKDKLVLDLLVVLVVLELV